MVLEKPRLSLEEIKKFVQHEVKGSEILFGFDPLLVPIKLPTDIPPLDVILGGGLPFGRTILVKGDFSAGKTFLSQKIICAAQSRELNCAYIDVEQCFSPEWFSLTGVNLKNILFSQPSSGEEALDLVIAFIKAGIDVVILDSVAALLATSEEEANMEKQSIGLQARLFNKGLRKITQANRRKSIFIAINQTRAGIGGPVPMEALPAGRGQLFFSSIILHVGRSGWLKDGDKKIGFNMKFFTEKNKLAPPFQTATIPFRFEGGILDIVAGLVEMALEAEVIMQKGPYYSHHLFEKGKILGKQGVIDFLQEHSDIADEIRKQIANS